MSRKLNFIPHISDYAWVREQMAADLAYRMHDRQAKTSLGRPLYYRINVQIVMTQECPYRCPFCLERQNPMKGRFNGDAQVEALKRVLAEHPMARLTVTGGEPGLYPDHVRRLIDTYHDNADGVFCSINTAGYSEDLNGIAHINLSWNEFVQPDPSRFPGCTLQTVIPDTDMTLERMKAFMDEHPKAASFSFRYLSGLDDHPYNVSAFNQLQDDPDIHIGTFRIGDFFVYATFDWKGCHARLTLGDMYVQKSNRYQDGYSNIIIHPDGRVATNWR